MMSTARSAERLLGSFAPAAIAALACCLATCTAAETANSAPRPTLVVPHAAIVPLVTAAADDPAWAAAVVIPSLHQAYNHEGPAVIVPGTTVKALWTAEALFLRCIAADDDIYTPKDQRDADLYDGDVFEIFLDPSGDGHVVYEIGAAPNGAVYDTATLVTATPVYNEALALDWNFVGRDVWFQRGWNLDGLRSAASRTAAGWTIDVVIPAKGLLRRLGSEQFTANQSLRANVLRYDWPKDPDGTRTHLHLDWSPTAAGRPHISAAALGTFRLAP